MSGQSGTAGDGELRHVTVLFCDLVDSTSLAAAIDPEEYRDILRSFQQTCAGQIEAMGGYVARFQGDGVFAYFGFPQVFEDSPTRAVRASLGIVKEMESEAFSHPTLSARIGIHAGITLVAEMGAGERTEPLDLVGEAPAVAARLQALAGPGEVVCSQTVQDSARGFISFEPLGEQLLKGIPEPMQAYRAQGETHARSRLEAQEPLQLSPLVGREQDITVIRDWTAARRGGGGVALVVGEAGVGKSRVVRAISALSEGDGWMTTFASATVFDQLTPMAVLVPLFDDVMATSELKPLREKLERSGLATRTAALFAGLLSEMLNPGSGALELPEDSSQRQRLAEAVAAYLGTLAELQPLLLVIEDLHWADASTLGVLAELAERPRPNITVLATSRVVPGNLHTATTFALGPLAGASAKAIADIVSGGAVREERLAEIVERAGGNALFVEELARAEREGRGSDTGNPLPSTLLDLLAARLESLGEARSLASTASVLGDGFEMNVLETLAEAGSLESSVSFERLLEAGILVRSGKSLAFRHAVIREAAYGTLLRSVRRDLHRKTADILETRFPDVLIQQPELVAQHAYLGGDLERSARLWLRASMRASARFAHRESIAQLRQGLEACEQMKPGEDSFSIELSLTLRLVANLLLWHGHADAEAGELLARAREIATHIPAARYLPAILTQSAIHAGGTGNNAGAKGYAEELIRAADSGGEPFTVFLAHHLLASTLFWGGEFREALGEFEIADWAASTAAPNIPNPDLHVASAALKTLSHWLLGQQEACQTWTERTLELAEAYEHPYGVAVAAVTLGTMEQLKGNEAEVRRLAGSALEVSEEFGHALWIAWATVLDAWADATDPGGLSNLRTAYESAAQDPTLDIRLANMLCERLLDAGEAAEANVILDRTIAKARETGEGFMLPELLRLKAAAAAADGRKALAGEILQEAVATIGSGGSEWYRKRLTDEFERLDLRS